MRKRAMIASLALSLLIAGCGGAGGSDGPDGFGTRVEPGTYGFTATDVDNSSQELFEGNVTVDAQGNLSGFVFGGQTGGNVSGTIDSDGTIDMSIAFVSPVELSGQLAESGEEYTGHLEGTVQSGSGPSEPYEANVVLGLPFS